MILPKLNTMKIETQNGNIECEKYFIHYELHKIDGPAVINYDSDGNVESGGITSMAKELKKKSIFKFLLLYKVYDFFYSKKK